MRFPTAQTGGAIIIFVLVFPGLAMPGLMTIVGDPRRWSKPDVYVCLAAAAYAAGGLTLYVVSQTFRRFIKSHLLWWHMVFLNPAILLMISLQWARYHDPVFPVFMLALIGWVQNRQMNAAATRRLGEPAVEKDRNDMPS